MAVKVEIFFLTRPAHNASSSDNFLLAGIADNTSLSCNSRIELDNKRSKCQKLCKFFLNFIFNASIKQKLPNKNKVNFGNSNQVRYLQNVQAMGRGSTCYATQQYPLGEPIFLCWKKIHRLFRISGRRKAARHQQNSHAQELFEKVESFLVSELSQTEFRQQPGLAYWTLMILEGIDLASIKRRRRYHHPSMPA